MEDAPNSNESFNIPEEPPKSNESLNIPEEQIKLNESLNILEESPPSTANGVIQKEILKLKQIQNIIKNFSHTKKENRFSKRTKIEEEILLYDFQKVWILLKNFINKKSKQVSLSILRE